MKTRFLILGIVLFVLGFSIFFIYVSVVNYPNTSHHKEIRPSIPDDHFRVNGMKWEWNNSFYDVNEEINFSVSRLAQKCGEVFDARIMNTNWSKTYWHESVKSKCDENWDDLKGDNYYSALVTADFTSENTIQVTQEGMYVLRVKSSDVDAYELEGHFIVKNMTN
jgi:hypothetical protein